jgi:hypothetical protein
VLILLAIAAPVQIACAGWPSANAPSSKPHPAVVRVIAPGNGSVSFGSGTLVAVNEKHGLVITNWHVINEATDTIMVQFPDGFRSAAKVEKTDKDWDLAALAIWRPNVEPVRISSAAPRPGEPLSIAGYGSGQYRHIGGPCTQYVSPGLKFPMEMVELGAAARQGDSGGPIFNARGELAGVLFGEGNGKTCGSYCGRVQVFVEHVVGDASQSRGTEQVASRAKEFAAPPWERESESAEKANGKPARTQLVGVLRDLPNSNEESEAPAPPSDEAVSSMEPVLEHHPRAKLETFDLPSDSLGDSSSAGGGMTWQEFAGETPTQQGKTILALVGGMFALVQVLRFLGRHEPEKKPSTPPEIA